MRMSSSGSKILIVDDEESIRCLLKCALSGPGRQLYEADCADRALKLAAEDGPFDLLISDVIMPGTMDGIGLACELHKRRQASAFLLVSGFCEAESDRTRVNGIQPCSFLAKPFTVPDLLSAVCAVLPSTVHMASVRDQRERQGLHRPRTPLDRAAVLRRISRRLRRTGQLALAEADHAARLNRLLRAEMQRHFEWVGELDKKLERQRVMLESYSGLFRDR